MLARSSVLSNPHLLVHIPVAYSTLLGLPVGQAHNAPRIGGGGHLAGQTVVLGRRGQADGFRSSLHVFWEAAGNSMRISAKLQVGPRGWLAVFPLPRRLEIAANGVSVDAHGNPGQCVPALFAIDTLEPRTPSASRMTRGTRGETRCS